MYKILSLIKKYYFVYHSKTKIINKYNIYKNNYVLNKKKIFNFNPIIINIRFFFFFFIFYNKIY